MNKVAASPDYREVHSAWTWPLLAAGLFGPATGVAILILLGALVNPDWFIPIFVLIFGVFLIPITLMYRNWPTGIRVDESAISIGAIGSARAPRRTPTVNHQSWGLFTCPWSAVEETRIVTDPAELRQMKDSPRFYTFTNRWGGKFEMNHCNTGVLASPFMRAALVIEVNPFAVTTSQVRPARFYSNFKNGRFSRLIPAQPSPTWVVPTRHPEALGRALQTIPANQRST